MAKRRRRAPKKQKTKKLKTDVTENCFVHEDDANIPEVSEEASGSEQKDTGIDNDQGVKIESVPVLDETQIMVEQEAPDASVDKGDTEFTEEIINHEPKEDDNANVRQEPRKELCPAKAVEKTMMKKGKLLTSTIGDVTANIARRVVENPVSNEEKVSAIAGENARSSETNSKPSSRLEIVYGANGSNPHWSLEIDGLASLPFLSSIENMKNFSESYPDVRQIKWDGQTFFFDTVIPSEDPPVPLQELKRNLEETNSYHKTVFNANPSIRVSQLLWTK